MLDQEGRANREQTKRLMTGEELYEMPNTSNTELKEGEVVYKMPTGGIHGTIEAIIAFLIMQYVFKNKSGRVMTGEVGIYTKFNPDSIRAADVAFISNQRIERISKPEKGYLRVAPELVIEIMSPDDLWDDIQEKINEYFGVDVVEVWVIDPKLKQIHQYSGPRSVSIWGEGDQFSAERVIPGLSIDLHEVFEPLSDS